MKDRPLTFTRFPGFSSLEILFFCARESYFMGEFTDKALQELPHESVQTRRGIVGDFIRTFLSYPIPREDPLVLFWEFIRSEKTHREIALIQIERSFPLIDTFVSNFLYDTLFSQALGELFKEEKKILTNREINDFLSRHLSEVSPSTFRSTRNTLRFFLIQVGLLKREEVAFPDHWEVRAYNPTLAGWLFAITSEGETMSPFEIDRIVTPRRFLMSQEALQVYLRETHQGGWGRIEEGKLLLNYPKLSDLIKEISGRSLEKDMAKVPFQG